MKEVKTLECRIHTHNVTSLLAYRWLVTLGPKSNPGADGWCAGGYDGEARGV
jgi:hypothetical protein